MLRPALAGNIFISKIVHAIDIYKRPPNIMLLQQLFNLIYSKRRNMADPTPIISQLTNLVNKQGFIYAYCTLVLKNIAIAPSDILDVNWTNRLNHKELSFLLGLMIKNPITLELPKCKFSFERQQKKAGRLLEELHNSVSLSEFPSFSDLQSEKFNSVEEILKLQPLVEPIFYDNPGAYDFQWLELASYRYAYDEEWFENSLGISIQSMINIAVEIKGTRANPRENECANTDLLDVFCIDPTQLHSEPAETVNRFFDLFSCQPGEANKKFDHINDVNDAEITPLIMLDQRYFLADHTFLNQSIYESPYYWMCEDNKYSQQALRNRGPATERIVYHILFDSNQNGRTYQGVNILKGKQIKAEIDVLFIYSNKAFVVQVKSKKLTALAKRGDRSKLKNDFQIACQGAYTQGLSCRSLILNDNTVKLVDNKGSRVNISSVDEIYILCITGDSYPALQAQQRALLEKKEGDPFPLIMSVFDLEIICSLLKDQIDLLYYVSQRTGLGNQYIMNSEMEILGLHLRSPLGKSRDFDVVVPEPQLANVVDVLFPASKGQPLPGVDTSTVISSYWTENTKSLHAELKHLGGPFVVDVIFSFYGLTSEFADRVVSTFDSAKMQTMLDGKMHDCSFRLEGGELGITLTSFPIYFTSAQVRSICFKLALRHKSDADKWFGLISIQTSSSVVDGYWFMNRNWSSPQIKIRNILT